MREVRLARGSSWKDLWTEVWAVARIAVLSFSDDRDSARMEMDPFVAEAEDRVVGNLQEGGHDVRPCGRAVWSNEVAVIAMMTA